MNTIYITNLFGKTIKDNEKDISPFILIHSTQPNIIVKNVVTSDNYSVWEPNTSAIEHVLYSNKFNVDLFSSTGHIFIPSKKLPNKITLILANKKFPYIKNPIDFTAISKLASKYTIWKPIGSRDYLPIGYIVSIDKPSTQSIINIHKNYLIKYRNINDGPYITNIQKPTNMNEFYLLGMTRDTKYTIKRSSLLSINDILNIKNNNSGNKLMNANIKFTKNGELKINNNCISVNDQNNIEQQKCDNHDNQKWYVYKNSIISDYNQQCMSEIGNDLVTENCNNDKKQKWSVSSEKTVFDDSTQEIDDNWKVVKGRKVVLVQQDDPWFLNKSRNLEGIIEDDKVELNTQEYQNYAEYDGKFKVDVTKPDMGQGHSYAARNCGNFFYETFDGNKYDYDTVIYTVSIAILLIFFFKL